MMDKASIVCVGSHGHDVMETCSGRHVEVLEHADYVDAKRKCKSGREEDKEGGQQRIKPPPLGLENHPRVNASCQDEGQVDCEVIKFDERRPAQAEGKQRRFLGARAGFGRNREEAKETQSDAEPIISVAFPKDGCRTIKRAWTGGDQAGESNTECGDQPAESWRFQEKKSDHGNNSINPGVNLANDIRRVAKYFHGPVIRQIAGEAERRREIRMNAQAGMERPGAGQGNEAVR